MNTYISASFLCNVSPFRMNTCKSIAKQRTLTIFRMNTYEKHRWGVVNQISDRKIVLKSSAAISSAEDYCQLSLKKWRSFSVRTDTSPIQFPPRSKEREKATTQCISHGRSAAAGSGSQTQ